MKIVGARRPGSKNISRVREISWLAKQRLKWMDHYAVHGNAALTCRYFGISRQTFYRWKGRYISRDLRSLEERSHRPRRLRKPTWSRELALAVLHLREQYPRWGKDKLVVMIRDRGWQVSTSMVGRILSSLKARGVLREALRSTISTRKRLWHRPYAVRKPKGYGVKEPGDLVQVDTLDVRPLPGMVLKHFTARDVVSRWDVVEAHTRATANTSATFLNAVLDRMPFPVHAIQVDGGSEFQAGFEEACREQGIRLFVLPPRSPKLNGCVERAQRTHTEEFYEVNDFSLEMAPLNRELLAWERIYNTVRPHQALGYLTPHQFVTRWLSHKKEVMCHPSTGRVRGVYFVPILIIEYIGYAECPFGSNPKLIPRWDVHFEGLEGYRRDSTEPHITHSPQLGDHRYCGLAICTFHLRFSLGVGKSHKKGFDIKMPRKEIYILIVSLAAVAAMLVACSGGLSEEDVEERAQELAKEMAVGGMTEADVEKRAMEMAEEMRSESAMMPKVERLQAVKDRGRVICASRIDVPGYGFLDESGNNVGFDIDLCKSLAAAVLGDPKSIEIRLITAAERGPAIQSGEVDMLVRTVTWTTSRDSQWGNYTQTMFYDGQGFMVRKDIGLSSALELKDASVCVTQGTTTELNLQDFSNQNELNLNVLTFEDTDAVVAAYDSQQCDSFTNDRSQLAALRTALANPDDHAILPETISEEPLGAVVPHGDDQWFDVVKTVMSILIYAEAYGVTSDSVPTTKTGDTKIDRLFGLGGSFGQESLGLSETVAQDVIKAVGNYGEIYDRNLGPGGIDLPRENGRNALWAGAPCTDCPRGGQIYAAPLR